MKGNFGPFAYKGHLTPRGSAGGWGRRVCDRSSSPGSPCRRMAFCPFSAGLPTKLKLQLGLQILYIPQVESFLEFTLVKGSPNKANKHKLGSPGSALALQLSLPETELLTKGRWEEKKMPPEFPPISNPTSIIFIVISIRGLWQYSWTNGTSEALIISEHPLGDVWTGEFCSNIRFSNKFLLSIYYVPGIGN